MVGENAKTDIGGSRESFQTTQWSAVYAAGTTDDNRRTLLIGAILQRYWKPVYCYLRRKGLDNERAKDLTQGFFSDILVNGTLLRRAKRSKGRFRTFLLTALDCYLSDEIRKHKAQKRSPRGQMVSLDDAHTPVIIDTCRELNPEQMFNYAWASQILDRTIDLVREECTVTGKETHWRLFQDRILVPIIENTKPPALDQLCLQYADIAPDKASNMIVTVKRCFRRILREQLRLSAGTDAATDSEYETLKEFLGRGAG